MFSVQPLRRSNLRASHRQRRWLTSVSYDAFLTRFAQASGIATPTRAELARFERTRTKKGPTPTGRTPPKDLDGKITQHPEAPARARLRVQPRTAHAAADGRRARHGPPRPRRVALFGALIGLLDRIWRRLPHSWASEAADRPDSSCDGPATHCHEHMTIALRMGAFTRGC